MNERERGGKKGMINQNNMQRRDEYDTKEREREWIINPEWYTVEAPNRLIGL